MIKFKWRFINNETTFAKYRKIKILFNCKKVVIDNHEMIIKFRKILFKNKLNIKNATFSKRIENIFSKIEKRTIHIRIFQTFRAWLKTKKRRLQCRSNMNDSLKMFFDKLEIMKNDNDENTKTKIHKLEIS